MADTASFNRLIIIYYNRVKSLQKHIRLNIFLENLHQIKKIIAITFYINETLKHSASKIQHYNKAQFLLTTSVIQDIFIKARAYFHIKNLIFPTQNDIARETDILLQ